MVHTQTIGSAFEQGESALVHRRPEVVEKKSQKICCERHLPRHAQPQNSRLLCDKGVSLNEAVLPQSSGTVFERKHCSLTQVVNPNSTRQPYSFLLIQPIAAIEPSAFVENANIRLSPTIAAPRAFLMYEPPKSPKQRQGCQRLFDGHRDTFPNIITQPFADADEIRASATNSSPRLCASGCAATKTTPYPTNLLKASIVTFHYGGSEPFITLALTLPKPRRKEAKSAYNHH